MRNTAQTILIRTPRSILLMVATITLLSLLTILTGTMRVSACSTPDACERAATECSNNGGVWNGAAGACTPTPRYNCITTGGDPQMMQTNRPGVPDGLELRCVCPEPRVSVDNRCVLQTDTSASTTDNIDIRETRESDCNSPNGEDLTEENCGIIGILNTAFNLVSGAVSLAVIGNIIVAGIQYSSAQGDPGAAAKAKTRIRNALLAFLMYLSLYGFIQWLIPGGVF